MCLWGKYDSTIKYNAGQMRLEYELNRKGVTHYRHKSHGHLSHCQDKDLTLNFSGL